ncbi:MAG: CPBP family intramembrane glutamic endopeptidase [Terracidiphilus sp.]
MEPIDEPSEEGCTEVQGFSAPNAEPAAPKPTLIAPVWHTVLLIIGILAVSLLGVYRHPGVGVVATNRIHTYGETAGLELLLLGWVAFGMRLRGFSLRKLFGKVSSDFRSIALDAGIALLFWMGSMMVLATVVLLWVSIEVTIMHKPLPIQTSHAGKSIAPDPSQEKAARAVVQLAPTNGKEIAYWLLLCALVGVAEELVFRGYLQQQFTAWGRGAAVAGVVFSAMMFGAAHGYEGVRAMFLLAVFGALFSLLALFRRNLCAGIFAHSWHDAFAGLMVALLHSHHVL